MAAAAKKLLPAPSKISSTSNHAFEWKRFKCQWLNYVKAAKVKHDEKDCKAAIFLSCIDTDA